MVRVSFVTNEFNPETLQVSQKVAAVLEVDGSQVMISGDKSFVSLDIPVVDPESGRRVTFQEDPELWAKWLPTAYRTGDVGLQVEEVPALAPSGRRRR